MRTEALGDRRPRSRSNPLIDDFTDAFRGNPGRPGTDAELDEILVQAIVEAAGGVEATIDIDRSVPRGVLSPGEIANK